MDTIGNILWIILGGFIIFFVYLFGSLVLMITIVGIPFGVQTLKLAVFSLFPFGKDIRAGARSEGCLYLVMNVIWILVAGIESGHCAFGAGFDFWHYHYRDSLCDTALETGAVGHSAVWA